MKLSKLLGQPAFHDIMGFFVFVYLIVIGYLGYFQNINLSKMHFLIIFVVSIAAAIIDGYNVYNAYLKKRKN